MFLAADIGGTKSLVALDDGRSVRFQRRYLNDAHESLQSVLAAFIADAAAAGITVVARHTCLAIAGPIAGERARLTNRPWDADAVALAVALPLGEVRLVNDFAATAAGLPTLAEGDVRTLQAGSPDDAAPRLVLGPGTGMGVAAWLPDAAGGRIVASEAGHVGFAPRGDEQVALLRFLGADQPRVTPERIVSGPGLEACYRFACGGTGVSLSAAEVTRQALDETNAPARRALDLFLEVFGAFAGDMALAFLARGGVYLAGGIVPRILPRLAAGPFLDAFNDKAEHAALAAAMPIRAVLCDDLPLRGALALARRADRGSG